MAGLSSAGLGSGLDINGLVTKLMEVEQQPLAAMAKKEAAYQAKLSAYGTLKSGLASLKTAMGSLSSPSQFNASKATVADSTVLTASTNSLAKTGSYSVEVTSLAQVHKISLGAVSDPTTGIGTGTLTIDFGTYDSGANTFAVNSDKTAKSITIDSSQNSLNGIRDAINAAAAGVTASIINDGSGYRLVVSSNEGGTENSLRVLVSGDSDGNNTNTSGLSSLAYNPTAVAGNGKNLTQAQEPKSAIVKVDGLTITKNSNTISDAIQGITLNLLKTNIDATTTLTVSRDTSGVKTAVQAFVKAYNELAKTTKSLGGYNAETKEAGVLLGDSALRSVQAELRSVVSQRIENNGGVTSLSDIGVSFQRDGSLVLNTTKLDGVLADPAKNVGSLFATIGVASDSLVTYAGSTSATQTGVYGLSVSEVSTQATVIASITPTATITAGSNDTLSLKVDGTQVNVTLTADNDYTAATLATEVQQKINSALSGTGKSVSVTDTDGKLRIASTDWGSDSQIQFLGGTAYSSVFGTPDEHGRVTGSQAAATSITTGVNDSLSLNVDGTSISITLAAGTYTAATLAAALESKINTALGSGPQVTVGESSGVLTIATTSTGLSSFVAVTGGTGLSALLGSPDAIAATGRDVAGTLGGAAASGSGQTLTGTSDASGLAILVSGGIPGARGTVTYNRGIVYQLNETINALLDESGTIEGRTDGINSSIKDIAKQRTALSLRLAQTEKRYREQFNALDSLIASMQQTSTYLTQQLESLSKSTSS